MTSITSTGINHFLFNKVKLQQTSTNYLNITEIQVWINGTNIATSATASASSVFSNNTTQFGPDNLIDGVLDSEPSNFDMAHTADRTNPWLLLTLDDSYNIKDLESIVIYNRRDDGASSIQFIYDRIIGTEMQIYYDDDLLYNHLISVGRPFYRFDGPAIGNVSSSLFSNNTSSTQIIKLHTRGGGQNQYERITSYITNVTSNNFNSLRIVSSNSEYIDSNEVQIWINGNNVALDSTSSNAYANDNDISGNGTGSVDELNLNVYLNKYYTINQIESIVIYSGHIRGSQDKGLDKMEDKQIELRNNGNIVYRTNIEHANHVYRIDGPAIKNVAQYENNFVDGSNNIVSHLAWSTMDEPISSPNKYYAPHVSNMCVNTFNKVEVRRIIEGFKRNSSHYTISSGGDIDACISIHELQIWVNIDGTATNVALNGITSTFDAYNSTPAAMGHNINDNSLSSSYTSASGSNTLNQKQFVAIDLAQEYNINDLISIVIYYAENGAQYGYVRRGNVGTGLSIYNNNTLLSTKVINRYESNGTSYDNSPLYDKAQLRFDGPQIEMWTGQSTTSRFYTASGTSRDSSFTAKIPSTSTSSTYSDHTSDSALGIARLYFANYYKPETSLHSHTLSLNMNNTRLISNTIISSNTTVFDISSSGVLQLPVGTDENIPKGTDAAIGQIRYNSAHDDYQGFQGYNGENWTILSGGERNMDNTTRVESITGTFNKLVWKRDYVDKYLSSHYSGYADTLTAMHAREIQIWVNVGGTLTNVAHTDGTASNSSVDNNGSIVDLWSITNSVSNINDEDIGNLSFTSDITANDFYTGEKRPSLTISLSNTYNISDLVCVVFWSRWDANRPRAIYNGRNTGTSLRLFQDSAEVAGYSIQQASKYYRIDGPAISNIANSNFMSSDYGGFDPTKVISTSYDSGDGELPHVASFDRVNMYTSNSLNMTVADEGRVGVNTSLPLHNLHINGDLKVKDGVKFLLDYNFYQSGIDGAHPNYMNKLMRTYDASYGVASFMSNYGDGFAFNESHGHINTTYQVNDKHQFALNKAQYYPPTISYATMERIVEPVVDNSNGYWKFNVNNDDYLWKAYNDSSPNTSLFDTVSNLTQGSGLSVDGNYYLHNDVSCNVDSSGGGWFILKLPEAIYAYGAAIGWPSWDLSGENCQKFQFYASQNGQFFDRIGDYDAAVSGHMTENGDITQSYNNYDGPIARIPDYSTDNYLSSTVYPKGITPFNTIHKSKRYQYFAVILTERADTSTATTSRSIGEFHIISNNSLWQHDSTRNLELPRKFTINNTGTVIETSSSDHSPGAALAIDNNLVISKDIDASPLSNNYNLYQKTFNEVRLTRKKPYMNDTTAEWIIQVNELQIWVNGRNIAPDGKVYAKNLPSSGINNLTNEDLATGINATSPTTKISDSEHYISVILPDSHNIEDIETLLLYNGSTPAQAIGYIIELRNFGNTLYKGEITENKSYYRFDGPSIGNVRTLPSATASTTHIVDDATNTQTFTISFPYDLSYSNAVAENNSVYVDGVIGIADLSTNTENPANIFTIDGSQNFIIDVSGNMTSKGGLVDSTNWDVSANTLLGDPAISIQSNVIEAKTLNVLSYVTTPPTIDFDFRLNTTENTVYDKVSGLKADISGSYVISKTGLDLSNSTLDNCAFIELEPFPIGGSFSIETYFLYKDSNSSNGHQRICEFSDGHYDIKAILLYRYENRLRVVIRNGTTNGNGDTTFEVRSDILSINTLYHVVVTVSNTHAYLYINGSVNHNQEDEDGIMDRNGTTTPVMHKTRSHYFINKPAHQDTPRSSYIMKYFRVYQNTTLSSDEVTKLYNTRDSFYDSNASIVDSHISLGSSIDHQNENIGANRLHFPRSGGIGVRGEILQYIGENSKGIQFYHNSNDLTNGTISMDLSVNIGNGFGTIGVGKFVDNTNYTLDVSGSIVNMYNTTDVSSIFHKTATTDCSGGIVLNSVNSGLQMLKNDGTNGLFIGQNGTYNSINLNGGSLKPATTLNANGNLSGNTDISFVQVDKCNDFVVNGSLITNDYEYNNNDTNVNIATNLGISTGNDKGMQVIQTSSSIRDANNRTFRKLRLYRESTSDNNSSRRYISLYEIQLWVNGTNVAATSGTVSGTPVHTGPYTRVNDGNFSNIFHAHNVEADNTIIPHPYIDISLNANYNINDIQAALIYFRTNNNTEKYRTQGIVLQLYNENDELLHTSPVTQPTSPVTLNNISRLYRYQGPAWNTLTSSHFTTNTGNVASQIFNNTIYGSYPVADRPLIAQQFRKIRVQKQRPSTFSDWSGAGETITIDKSLYMPNKTGTNNIENTDSLTITEIQVWVNGTNVALSGFVSGTTESNILPLINVNGNKDSYYDSYSSVTGHNNPFVDIDLAANYNVSDIQSMIVYYPINKIDANIRCIGTHVELYDEFDNKVYQSNSVKNPCHALRIDGPAFKYFTGSFFSTRGTTTASTFPSGIVSTGSRVKFHASNTDIVVKVNHEKMDNMLEIINTNGDTPNAGHFVAEPSISVVDSNGNVGINTSAPRAGAKLDIYNAHNPSPGYGLFPVGFTMMFCAGKDKVPSGWLLCDGTTYSTSDYPALGAILGHQGTGTDNGGNYGITTTGQFKVPDLKEKFPILANTASNYTGLSNIDTNGQLGNNVCNVSQLASHSHSISNITEDHTITVDHVLKTDALDGVNDANKSDYPVNANAIKDSFSSNTTHLGYIPLHTNIHGQPDYDNGGNTRKQQIGGFFSNSNNSLKYGVYHFVSHESGDSTKEMFPRIKVKASDANLKPSMVLNNQGGTDHRRPQYTVVNFIMYSGVHETTTYGAKGWSS